MSETEYLIPEDWILQAEICVVRSATQVIVINTIERYSDTLDD